MKAPKFSEAQIPFAMTLADRIVVFSKGQIEQIGAPMELYERPANMFVAGFIGAPAMTFPMQRSSVGGETRLSIGSFDITPPLRAISAAR